MDKDEFIVELDKFIDGLIGNSDFWYHVLKSDFLAEHGLPEFLAETKSSKFPVESDSVEISGQDEIPVKSKAIAPWDWPTAPAVAPQRNSIEKVDPNITELIRALRIDSERLMNYAIKYKTKDALAGIALRMSWVADALTLRELRK